MANYIILGCDGITNLVVDDGPYLLTPGNTYYINFTAETFPGCFTIIEETQDPAEDGVSNATEYNNCLSCLQQNSFSFFAEDCLLPEQSGFIDANSFSEWPVGKYYKLCQEDELGTLICLCLYIKEVRSEPGVILSLTGPFTECGCIDSPRSANTESNLCIEICDEVSGTTVVSVSPPHPVWTDGYGTSVTQLNAITLGGENGLNN